MIAGELPSADIDRRSPIPLYFQLKKLLEEQIVSALWASDALGLPPGSEGVTVERLRSVDDRPVMYVVNHLPRERADTVLFADLEGGSLYRVLEEREGLTVLGGRRV